MTTESLETRDIRDSRQVQWHRWRQMSAPEEMCGKRGGGNGETGIWKGRWWNHGTAGTATADIQYGGYGGLVGRVKASCPGKSKHMWLWARLWGDGVSVRERWKYDRDGGVRWRNGRYEGQQGTEKWGIDYGMTEIWCRWELHTRG